MGVLNINKTPLNKTLRVFLKFFISGLLLAWVFHILDFRLLIENLQKFSIKHLGVAMGLCFLILLILTVRWCYMAKNQIPGPLIQYISRYWLAHFFNLISPASLGGDIYRVVAYRDKTSKGLILPLGLVIQERFIGLMAFCLSYLIFLGTSYTNNLTTMPSFFSNLGILFGVGFLSLLFMQFGLRFFSRKILQIRSLPIRWKERISVLSEAIQHKSLIDFLIIFLLTLMSLSCWIGVFWILAKSIVEPAIPFDKLGLISIVTEISRWLPITIQGVGIREGVAVYGFEAMHFKTEAGFLICGLAYLINSLILMICGAIGAIILNFPALQQVFISPNHSLPSNRKESLNYE